MKYTHTQLTASLQQSIAPLYVIASNDPVPVQQAVHSIRDVAAARGFTDRHWFCPTNRQDWEHLLNLQKNMDLFHAKKIIEIFLPNGKLGQVGAPYLTRCIDQINADQILIITLDKMDRTLQNSRWVLQCEKAGVLVIIPSPIENLIASFLPALWNKNSHKSLELLTRMQQQKIEPTWIVWQLAQHIRQLLIAKPSPALKKAHHLVYELDAIAKGNPLADMPWPDTWSALRHFILEINRAP